MNFTNKVSNFSILTHKKAAKITITQTYSQPLTNSQNLQPTSNQSVNKNPQF